MVIIPLFTCMCTYACAMPGQPKPPACMHKYTHMRMYMCICVSGRGPTPSTRLYGYGMQGAACPWDGYGAHTHVGRPTTPVCVYICRYTCTYGRGVYINIHDRDCVMNIYAYIWPGGPRISIFVRGRGPLYVGIYGQGPTPGVCMYVTGGPPRHTCMNICTYVHMCIYMYIWPGAHPGCMYIYICIYGWGPIPA